MKKVKNTRIKVYKHLQNHERDEIAYMLGQGFRQVEIAARLGRHPSSLSREIKRNGSSIRETRYRANRAQLKADERKRLSHKKMRLKNDTIRNYVIEKLSFDHTPEQIAGRIRIEKPGYTTNYESIYLFIYNERPDLTEYLVRGKRKRHKRSIKPGKRIVKIANRTMINERPKKINERLEYGHWEADTIVSRQSKSALVVVRERKLQLMFIRKIPRKNAKNMRDAVISILEKFPKRFCRSITFDNGLENADHELISRKLKVKTYFCNPYHSWEKGGVENGIGLVRRYYPKKTDFSLISSQEIYQIEKRLNNRPRKTLGFLTPLEVYKNCA
ncbi:MAG TPA: IS30 family transposase [Spirochaetota bacterium]|nr:IS30 family transposase [Spirochaetota bacterium]